MTEMIRSVLEDPGLAAHLAASGLQTIQARHTCAHRAAELLDICSLFGRETAIRVARPEMACLTDCGHIAGASGS
jgi:hypothetical protein